MAMKPVDIKLGGLNLDNPPMTFNGQASDIANYRFDDSGAIQTPPLPKWLYANLLPSTITPTVTLYIKNQTTVSGLMLYHVASSIDTLGQIIATRNIYNVAVGTYTNLTAGIDSAVTTIPVASTAAFSASGYIVIDENTVPEVIFYSSKDATNFLGCTRGAAGTIAVSHLINHDVYNPGGKILTGIPALTGESYFLTLNKKTLLCGGLTTGVATPVCYDRTSTAFPDAFTAITDVPAFLYPEVHYDYIFGGYTVANPSRIYWNTASDMASGWNTATRYVDFGADDLTIITGLKSFAGDLYVFKTDACWKIVGNDFTPVTGNYSKILTSLPGCISHKSIAMIEGSMYWMSKSGMVKYNGSEVEYIGRGIVDDYLLTSALIDTASTYTKISCVHNQYTKEIYLMIRWGGSGGTEKEAANKTSIYTYNIPLKLWSRLKIPIGAAALDCLTINGTNVVFSVIGVLYVFDTRVNASAYDLWPYLEYTEQYYQTDWLTFGDNQAYKTYGRLLVTALEDPQVTTPAQTFYVKNYVNMNTTEVSSKTVTLTSDNVQKVPLDSVPCKAIRLKLGKDSLIINTKTDVKKVQIVNMQLEVDLTDNGRI